MRLTPLLLTAMLAAVSGALAAEMPNNWGYDIRGGNQTTGPGDDFNTFANGAFLDSLTIPPDRSSYGVDEILSDRVENQIKELLESNAPTVPDAVKTHVLYQAFMDQQRVDAAGATPLAFDLAAVNQARTRLELAALMGTSVRSFQASLFDLSIEADAKSTAHYTVVVSQSDLGLPDRDYYLQAQFADQKMKYGEYIAQILALVGWPDATIQAANILAYETRLADASWPREQERDPNKIYNPTTTADLVAAAPGFCWQAFLKAAGLGSLPRLVIQESTALPRLAAIYRGTPVETLRAWAAFHLMDHAAPELAKPFVDANFAFHNGVLSGQPQQLPRWKRGVALVNTIVGDAVGRAYVAAYVPPEAKARVVALVADLRAAFAARIQQVDWMSPETREKAVLKLSQLAAKVGYPDKWRDYSKLDVQADDLYGDMVRIKTFDWNRQLNRLNQPVDHEEWEVTPQTVNAFYNPTANEIVLPAAILQAPYFDVHCDAAFNYGSIGSVIGHEMTHGFDDAGRHLDGTGALANWWTAADAEKFDVRAAMLATQYDHYEAVPGVHLNGKLTNGENIADLGGVLISLDAYHRSLHGEPAPVTDGLTGDQRFFLAFARSWREKRREAEIRQRVVSNSHSPEPYRVNGVLRNVDAWYRAFSVRPGDRLYLDPTERVHIW